MDVLRKLNRVLSRRQKAQIAGLLVLMLIGAALETVSVSMILPIVAAITQADALEANPAVIALAGMLRAADARSVVLWCLIALTVLYAVKNTYLYFFYAAQSAFVSLNQFLMSQALLQTLLARPYEFFLNANTADLAHAIENDVSNVWQLLGHVTSIMIEGVVSAALFAFLLWLEPGVTLVMTALLGGASLVVLLVIRPAVRAEGQKANLSQRLRAGWLLQMISGVREVRLSGTAAYFQRQYAKCGQIYADANRKRNVLNNLPRLLIETVCVAGLLLYLAVSAGSGRDIGGMLPEISVVILAAVRVMPGANRISGALVSITYLTPSLDRLAERLRGGSPSVPREETALPGAHALTLVREIFMRGITYCYPGSDTEVLREANIRIPAGACVGIVGPSGSGKSTLIGVLLGLLTPSAGTVTCDGTDVSENIVGWRAMIGCIPQSVFLLDGSVRDNVAFGCEHPDDERVWAVLEEARLREHVLKLPGGLDALLGERGCKLSGGQQQRVGIARALYADPQILVFDEATSSLDHETEAEVFAAIERLRGKKTIVVISHRAETLQRCDSVYRVGEGSVAPERMHARELDA